MPAVSSDIALLSVVQFLKSVIVTNLHHQSCQAFIVVGFGTHCTLNAGKRKTLGGVLGARSQGVLNSSRCNLIMVRVFLSFGILCTITRAQLTVLKRNLKAMHVFVLFLALLLLA
jgi:hypothetical protein